MFGLLRMKTAVFILSSPNIINLFQWEHPQIVGGTEVGMEKMAQICNTVIYMKRGNEALLLMSTGCG